MPDLRVPDTALSSAGAKTDAITEAHLTVFWAITLWYNGIGIKHGSRVYHIGTHKPPSLQTLIGCTDAEWEEVYEPAFQDIKHNGGMTEKTLLRRKVPWVPTESFLKLTGELFGDYLEQIVVPHTAFNENKGHIGDPIGSLLHRTEVEQTLSWITELWLDWMPYPGKVGHKRPDIRGTACHPFDEVQASYIECISDHNNKEMYMKKYTMFSNLFGTSLWIFKNRKAAAVAMNFISETPISNYIDGDTPFCRIDNTPLRNPENYSVKTLNRYLKQSRENPELSCTGMDYVQTLTGVYEDRGNGILRTPITIWDTTIGEIRLLGPAGEERDSITIEELHQGHELRILPWC
jgi:hypothetical protein